MGVSFIYNLKVLEAGERRFVFSNETETMVKGEWELEHFVTWKHYDNKDRFDFRHELEYGVTDNFQVALYIADWRYETFDEGDSKASYRDTALEMIYSFSNPTKDLLGSAIYLEGGFGPEKAFFEAKLLLQKNIGSFSFVYNFKIEAEWEGEDLSNLNEEKGEFANTFGVSYQINPFLLVGFEALHEFELKDWSEKSDDYLHAGPNISVRKGKFFATCAVLFDVLDKDSALSTQTRLITGMHF